MHISNQNKSQIRNSYLKSEFKSEEISQTRTNYKSEIHISNQNSNQNSYLKLEQITNQNYFLNHKSEIHISTRTKLQIRIISRSLISNH
jgi:hypothetical protein